MFQGIVAGAFPVETITSRAGLKTFGIALPHDLLKRLETGASVSVSGVCLTVTGIHDGRITTFDAMMETLSRTNLDRLEVGDSVNVERSLRMGDEIGGHLLSGHIDAVAEIVRVDAPENNRIVTFKVASKWMKYIFEKGFIALDGASLMIAAVDREKEVFSIYLIPETLRRTTFGVKRAGDAVNMEIDRQTQAIVETVERITEAFRPVRTR